MKNILLIMLLALVVFAAAVAQNEPSPSAAGTSVPPSGQAAKAPAENGVGTALQQGSLIYAELSKSIDSKKAKVGDPVVARTTQAILSHGRIAVPKGARIIGHLTAAKAHTKDQPQAELGIVFDRAELKDGSQVPLTSVSIQALGGIPSSSMLDQSSGGMDNGTGGASMGGGGMSGGARSGGMTSPMAGPTYPPPRANTSETDTGAATGGAGAKGGQLSASSRGVIGMPGVTLQPGADGSVVSADKKNVKLDSGIQMVLRTNQ
jgi:hypothetical protein